MDQPLVASIMQDIGDPHVDLLQRVTKKLDNMFINLVQGGRVHSTKAMPHLALLSHQLVHLKEGNTFATIVVKTNMVWYF